MGVRKQAVALLLAVLLAFTSASPAAASAAHMPQAQVAAAVSGNGLEDPVSADAFQKDLPQESTDPGFGEDPNEDLEKIGSSGEPEIPEGIVGDDQETADEVSGSPGDGEGILEGAAESAEDTEVLEEEAKGAAEESGGLPEHPEGTEVPDVDAAGYTGAVDIQDIQDQEKLDKALADGLVELVPNEDEDGYQRAGAAGENIIDVASREVGVSGRPNKYTYWLGAISGTYSYAWCHAFVSWCGAQTGNGQVPRSASCFYGAQEFKARGKWKNRISGYVPKAGDIIYFDWNANGGYDHVGIVHYVSGGRVHTIEGNAGDAVRYDGGRAGGYALTDSQIIGYGTPDYRPVPQTRGCLDTVTGGASSVHAAGWAFDEKDPAQALDVHVYVGGPAGSGAPGYAVRADKTRADVGAAYPGMGSKHGFDADIIVSRTGSQPVYVYAISTGADDINPLIGTGTVNIQKDAQKPVIRNIEVKDISVEGYTVTCQVTDNVGIKKVSFPSWHESKSGEQAVWFEGTVKDGTAQCFIPVEELGGQSGKYTTHIYAYDKAGNHTAAAVRSVTIDHTSLRQYNAKNISTDFIARIENAGSGLALTGLADAQTVAGREDTGAAEQIWRFTREADQSYIIQLSVNGAYLTADPSQGTVRALLQEDLEAATRWRVLQAGEDSYYLDPENDDSRVLTQGAGDTPVSLQTFDTSEGQQFKIQKLSTNIKSLTLKKESLTFTEERQTGKLTVSIRPKSAADERICWASSQEKVATVDKNGLVTAIGNGTANITAATEDGSITAVCAVTVKIRPTGVSLSKKSIKFESKGATKKLQATVSPKNAKDRSVTWKSSNKKVAAVDQSGLVRAVSNGTATITAETVDGKRMAACDATVQIPKVGAGGTVRNGSYTYSADHIKTPTEERTVIYRQKKGGKKEKLAQISAKAYIKLLYDKKLYYEKTTPKGRRDLYALDTRTLKKGKVRADSVIVGNRGRRFLVRPYAAKAKPQACYLLNVATGREVLISKKCLAASLTASKVYYVEAVSGKTAKGWKAQAYSCSYSAKKLRSLTGKIAMTACDKVTSKAIVYKSGASWYSYTYAAKKSQKVKAP